MGRHSGAEVPSNAEGYEPQHAMPEMRFSPETERLLEAAGLLEHLRTNYGDSEQVTVADLQQAVELASTGVPPEVGREMVGSFHEVSATDERYRPYFDELKQAVYHTTEVEPVELRDRRSPDEREQKLTGDELPVQWHGSPIHLRVLDSNPSEDTLPNPDADITLTRGSGSTWNVRIGEQEPFALDSNQTVMLGRDQLGGNVYTSREHLDLTVDAGGDMVVRDRKTGTHYATRDYPDPALYEQPAATAEPQRASRRERLNEARAKLGRALRRRSE